MENPISMAIFNCYVSSPEGNFSEMNINLPAILVLPLGVQGFDP